jgi:AraC family transcriptional regulator, regulatory protein of adaptative response / methylated-DNA-[protein]-cysteine methyltransferase
MTPARYLKQGGGVTIRYTVADTAVGKMLLAATGRGICSIRLGDSDEILERELRGEYPKAETIRADRELEEPVKKLLATIEGKSATALPLDIQATAFQRRVWETLQAIPRGATKSYREIAVEIGDPKAARAVARACATNPVAIAIPCHRVVRQDGRLSGYRWGEERKRKLLELEAAESPQDARSRAKGNL